jgi:hypothetical protein
MPGDGSIGEWLLLLAKTTNSTTEIKAQTFGAAGQKLLL